MNHTFTETRTMDAIVERRASSEHAAHRPNYRIRPREHHAFGFEVETAFGTLELFDDFAAAEKFVTDRTGGSL